MKMKRLLTGMLIVGLFACKTTKPVAEKTARIQLVPTDYTAEGFPVKKQVEELLEFCLSQD